MLTVGAVGLASKLFLRLGCSEVHVNGLPILLEALKEENRQGQGIITVANHISVWDDPVAWGVMPWRSYFSSRTTRWTLGASDIVFTNPLLSQFFRNGQVIETVRGQGIHQEALDVAIKKLNGGDWIHIFPEGKVNQVKLHPGRGLLRFKWGVAHMMLRAKVPPKVIPIYLEGILRPIKFTGSSAQSRKSLFLGFDDVMPENRGFPRFLPRLGSKIRVTFGEPAGITQEVGSIIEGWKSRTHRETGEVEADPEAGVRIALTDVLQRAVTQLGDDVTRQPHS
ncbi:hypothetical protein FRC01_003029 [Tulasnella sp. 417]|nr:hypothetical protein FRC01_003029 [Tulasnella sp. 417]